ncbi:MAG: hypothetical protein AAFV43_16540 [Planctomycetota bacterium]
MTQGRRRFYRLIDTAFERVNSHVFRNRLEKAFVAAAVVGFFAHLAVIATSRAFPSIAEAALGGLDRNFLHAIYTPFSFILFYEVLLLTLAIPQSHTGSIAIQYQIVSLIVVRRVFKDLGGFADLDAWVDQPEASLAVLLDMATAVLMFVLATAFDRLRRSAVRKTEPADLAGFVTLKRGTALLLGGVLVGLAISSVVAWLGSVWSWFGQGGEYAELDLFFFPAFFEVMIFTDVFLLIISIAYYDRYEIVFRNAGFVISTVLLRASLTSAPPYNSALGILAMAYGVAVLWVFVLHSKRTEAGSKENLAGGESETPPTLGESQ